MRSTAALIAILTLAGCGSPIVPHQVQSNVASFDGNEQNSGFLGWVDGMGKITRRARDRYNGLIVVYGRDFNPPLGADYGVSDNHDGTYLITKEALNKFLEMSAWKRASLVPVNP